MSDGKDDTGFTKLALPGYGLLLSREGNNSQKVGQIAPGPTYDRPGRKTGLDQGVVYALVTETGLFGGYIQYRILIPDDADLWTKVA